MFPRIAAAFLYAFFALSLLAAATPNPIVKRCEVESPPAQTVTKTDTDTAPGPTQTASGQCNTGPIQCCEQTVKADSEQGSLLLGLLGIVLTELDVLLGVNCSPISVIGVGGSTCSAKPVCCQNNSQGSLISIGCVVLDI